MNAKGFGAELCRKLHRKRKSIHLTGAANRTKILATILHGMAYPKYRHYPYSYAKRKQVLCDFMWLQWTKAPRNLHRLVLAAESEWDIKKQSIIYDFQKLLLVKADFKVFFFKTIKNQGDGIGDRIRENIRNVLEAYSVKDEREHYFIVEIDLANKKVHVHHARLKSGGFKMSKLKCGD